MNRGKVPDKHQSSGTPMEVQEDCLEENAEMTRERSTPYMDKQLLKMPTRIFLRDDQGLRCGDPSLRDGWSVHLLSRPKTLKAKVPYTSNPKP